MVRDSFTIGKFQELSSKISNDEAMHYLRQGYGIRALQIKDTHFQLTKIIEKSGGKNLTPYETTKINLLLNAYYLNLIGAIDNLAWALHYGFNVIDGARENNKKRTQIGLFSKTFQESLKLLKPDVVSQLNQYKDWFFELKEFRDPAAHRIPLYCAPGVVKEEHRDEYNKAKEHYLKQDYRKDRDGYMNAQWALGQVGVFEAIFICYTESFEQIIYPLNRTVNDDYQPFWEVSEIVHQCLDNRI
ncbi:hypothetical protein VT25_18180 [Photobacterium leiognathi subsp. mandapamensis]|nr:hypothetical protein VT25_18180 [Photobacterium leiognathi subsp. mandapamensis]